MWYYGTAGEECLVHLAQAVGVIESVLCVSACLLVCAATDELFEYTRSKNWEHQKHECVKVFQQSDTVYK